MLSIRQVVQFDGHHRLCFVEIARLIRLMRVHYIREENDDEKMMLYAPYNHYSQLNGVRVEI